MAKRVVKTTVSKDGRTRAKTTTDTSRMSGRQQIKRERKSISDNAMKTAIAGEAAASYSSSVAERERTKRQNEQARQETYQKAIAKWNGIVRSTPENAEGTDPSLEGESVNSSNTGTNPGSAPATIKGA